MKIILANKYHFLKGGAERHVFELSAGLRRLGHEVVPFAMRSPRDEPTPWSKNFVSPVETGRVSWGWSGLRTAGRFLWSFEAARRFGRLLDATKPDLVHLHNIYHQISPSILPVAKKRGLPVIMTVHDYALLAPNYSLFHDGRICEVTKPDRFCRAIGHRCVRGSRAASALCALELLFHRRLYARDIDRFIVPSRFVGALMVEYGFDPKKIDHLPHFVDAASRQPSFGAGEYALYVGRLSGEKGVDILVRAAARCPDVPVRIVGTGPDEARLKALAAEIKAFNVDFRGAKYGAELGAEYAGARFVVIPSVWYEPFGLIALEAYAAGKPVVASEIGGLAELLRPGETGVPVSAGDIDGLAEVLAGYWKMPTKCIEMGRAGRAWVERDFTPAAYFQRLGSLYRGLIEPK